MPRVRPLPLLVSSLLIALAACADRTPTAVAPPSATAVSLDRMPFGARRVSPTGTDAGDCTTAPCLTIGYAIGQANPGDVVAVAAGTYPEAVTVSKRLTLQGRNATIDASGHDQAVVISGADAAGTSLTGFTIQNAGLEGVFVLQTTRVTIADNLVRNNDAYGPDAPQCVNQPDDCGEAIHLQSVTKSTVRGNTVRDNVGGILLTDENGPTSGNLIADNTVLHNPVDCGITLASHWFNPAAAATADVAGVYRNVVLHNTSDDNGAAGIGVFAGPPGAAAWGNVVAGNTARNNGEGGVMIHSHTPSQYVNDNVVIGNALSGNGQDPDNPAADATADISIFAAAVPIPHTVVAANRMANAHYGVIAFNAVKISGLRSNQFAGSITVPVSLH